MLVFIGSLSSLVSPGQPITQERVFKLSFWVISKTEQKFRSPAEQQLVNECVVVLFTLRSQG